jgi:hypothetical protein
MNTADIRQRITQKLNNLDFDQLTLVESFLNQFTAYLGKAFRREGKQPDPLANLRNSDFIGCFSDEPDLATNSEEIVHRILSQTGENQP